jgi:hypothetical protein
MLLTMLVHLQLSTLLSLSLLLHSFGHRPWLFHMFMLHILFIFTTCAAKSTRCVKRLASCWPRLSCWAQHNASAVVIAAALLIGVAWDTVAAIRCILKSLPFLLHPLFLLFLHQPSQQAA